MFMVMPFGASASVWLAGRIYDTSGSYNTAMWISLVMGVIGAVAVAMPSTGIAKKLWPQMPMAR